MPFKKLFVFAIFVMLTSGCLFEKRLYRPDGSYVVEQEGSTLATVDLKKKGKKRITDPSIRFSELVFDFRKKIGRFPKTILELGDFSFENRNQIREMMAGNYSKLEVAYSSTDSLMIKYEYHKFTLRELEQLQKSSGRVYSGTYIYSIKNNIPSIINHIDKTPLIRVSKD